ncbi:metalloregulator ArsR/SmtB family transcription factor [Deltaproteobacteria bacterium TL4]
MNLKKELFEQLARLTKALSHGNRLELLELLAQGRRSVDALAKASGLSIANTSQHLRQLQRVGLVSTQKESQFVYYQLADESVVGLFGILRRIAESSLAEVEKLVRTYITARDTLEPVSAEDLLLRIKNGLVTVIDMRPKEEFEAGHIAGAINIPLQELERRLVELDCSQEIVAYCRGPYCMLAVEAVSILNTKGYHAQRLENGFPEWKQTGFPIELGITH